ncbi:MAG: hypothetical protein WCR27_03305 [Eubacteriales bacterium]
MKFLKLYGIKLIVPIAIIAGFIVGALSYGTVVPATASSNSDQSIQDVKQPTFPVNKNGETYGSNSEVTITGYEPDLILAKGVDGTDGYIKLEDLNKNQPNNPEEAVAYMEKMKNSPLRTIPLYASDGETVIGEFKIDIPEVIEITNGKMDVVFK